MKSIYEFAYVNGEKTIERRPVEPALAPQTHGYDLCQEFAFADAMFRGGKMHTRRVA